LETRRTILIEFISGKKRGERGMGELACNRKKNGKGKGQPGDLLLLICCWGGGKGYYYIYQTRKEICHEGGK